VSSLHKNVHAGVFHLDPDSIHVLILLLCFDSLKRHVSQDFRNKFSHEPVYCQGECGLVQLFDDRGTLLHYCILLLCNLIRQSYETNISSSDEWHKGRAVQLLYYTNHRIHHATFPSHSLEIVLLNYTVKKVSDFPVPSLDVTNQTIPGRGGIV
jgi:hypothetical protein